VRDHLAGGLRVGAGKEVGGDADPQLFGVPGVLAGLPVDLDGLRGMAQRPADLAEDHGQAEQPGPVGAAG
jgi:hypothetical protein